MSSNWFLRVLIASLVAFEQCIGRPDFGVPALVVDSGTVGWNAYLLGGSMNELLSPINRILPNMQSENPRSAAGNLSMLVLNVTEIGRNLANSIYTSASERNVPFEDLFKSLYTPFEEMKQFLTNHGLVVVKHLNETMGNVTAYELDGALEGLNASLLDNLIAVNNLEFAINTSLKEENPIPAILNVPNTLPQALSKALEKLRDQVGSLGRAVDASVRSIEASNSIFETVNSNIRAVESGFQAALSQFNSTIDDQLSSAVNKYSSAQKSYQSDLATATQLLKIFSSNKTLNDLSNIYSEEYTANYYTLYNRNKSDSSIISNAFNSIRMESSNDVNQAGLRFFGAVNDTTAMLMTVILARERFAEQCNGQFSSRITSAFPGFQTETVNCLNRERSRIPRIVDAIDRVLLLVQSNSVDFSSDIGSCAKFSSYATNEADYLQAKACLEANLREMETYNRLMNAQLDSLKPVLAAEAEASHFRTRQCIMQTANEMKALVDGVKGGVVKCAVDGS